MSPTATSVDELHGALVAACGAPDEELAAGLRRVFDSLEIDGVDPVSAELLPLLYRRMANAGIDHPTRRRLRYFYLQTWRRNQALLHRARPVFDELARRSAPFVVLKGGAMASSRYRDDLGVRPMGDLDVLVAPDHAPGVLDWMLEHGWRVDDTLGWTHPQYLTAHHAVSMLHGDDGAIDLHVGLLSTDRSPSLDRELIRRAVPATLGGHPVRVLDSTSQMMHTLSHSNPNGLRHLIDARYLARTRGDEIDWDELGEQVIRRRSIARTAETLARLREFDPTVVPERVDRQLAAAPRHWSDWSYQGQPMASVRGLKIFASRLAQRSRGETLGRRLRIGALLARHYLHAASTDF